MRLFFLSQEVRIPPSMQRLVFSNESYQLSLSDRNSTIKTLGTSEEREYD